MNPTAITVQHLTVKAQGNVLLKDLSFVLEAGSHLVITGASGSGKTTLLKALARQNYFEGAVEIHHPEHPDTKPRLLFIPQQHSFKNGSNLNSFYYQQRFNSMESDDADTVSMELEKLQEKAPDGTVLNIKELLQKLRLDHRKDAPVLQLSSGEHKRLQLAKALLLQPDILLLDQPFTGLDVAGKKMLHELLERITEKGTQLIFTGRREDMPPFLTHLLVLDGGKMAFFGLVEDTPEFSAGEQSLTPSATVPPIAPFFPFEYAVRMVNVSVAYNGKQVIKDLNWDVKRGERWLLRGENGAGKSTLLSLLNGDNPQAYSNEIYLFDKKRGSGESIWDIKKNIGYASPELHWYFDKNLTVIQTIASGFFDTMGLFRQLSAEQLTVLKQWMQYFGLDKSTQKLLSSLSSGEQRLCLLARALVKNPPLLILDEPCQGLDEEQTQRFVTLLDALMETSDQTLIYVTHNSSEIPGCITHEITLKQNQTNHLNKATWQN